MLTAGLASPAFGDEPQSDQLWINTHEDQSLPLGTADAPPQSRTVHVGLSHDNANFSVTKGRLSVDVSGLAGIAEVSWPDNCAPDGTHAVCDIPVVPTLDDDYADQVSLTVRAADGAKAGARGKITYEATATGGPDGTLTAPEDSFDTTLTVSAGPDLSLAPVSDIEDGLPGELRTIPFEVTNNGNRRADGFTVTLYTSYGLTDLTPYDGCTSTTPGGGAPSSTTTVCTFDTALAPGESAELPEPLAVRLAPYALNERFDIDVEPGRGAEDIESGDNYRAVQIGVKNTADFSVAGDTVTAAAGETVTAALTFRNNGPAWFGNLGSGDPVAAVRLLVPAGTTVTDAPYECIPHTLAGGYYPQRSGAPRYDCKLPRAVRESATHTFELSLRVDTVVPGAKGAVSIHPAFGEFGTAPFDFDPDTSNNTSALTVN
nr:hypothetical protein [Streptomyces sp. SID11385]